MVHQGKGDTPRKGAVSTYRNIKESRIFKGKFESVDALDRHIYIGVVIRLNLYGCVVVVNLYHVLLSFV